MTGRQSNQSRGQEFQAKIERSSLGTPSARAARRSVPESIASRIVARSQETGKFTSQSQNSRRKSGG